MTQQNQQQQASTNQVMSMGQRLSYVLGMLQHREEEISAVLPPDMTFKQFHATINQALRSNMDLLECTSQSLVNACIKSAYDGLRVDGKEAAIVSHNVKVKTAGQPDRWEKHAQYFPMVYGLIQQILRGGTVVALDASVIYANEHYRIVRGSTPFVEHEPMMEGDRGDMIAVYSVATFASGYTSTLAMRKDEVEDVRMASKSGNKDGQPHGVWKRWPSEMWKKTVLRRHRKTLPIARDVVIIDSEANEEFAPISQANQLPVFATSGQQQARPTRQMIADQQGTGSGMPLDMGGGFDGSTGEIIDHDRDDRHEDPRDQQQDQQREVQQDRGQQDDDRDNDLDLPDSDQAWAVWGTDIERKLAAAKDSAELDRVWKDSAPIRVEASKAIRDRLTGILTDRTADMAADAAAGAGADEQ